MLKIYKKIPVALMVLLIFSSVGCSQAKSASTASTESTSTSKAAPVQTARQVIDANGTKVAVPKKIDRIVITCQGGTTQDVAIFGAADKIVAQPTMKAFPELLKIYPKFKDIVDPGSFDAVNIEEIVKANPDMVLVGITSKKGNKLIADAGFPTYTMYIGMAGIDSLKKEFKQVGTLLGNEQKADELINYWDQKMAYINSMVSKVPSEQKKHVLYTSSNLASVSGKNVWGNDLITASGGLNAAAEITDSSTKVSVEQIMKWNPDVIIVQKNGNAAEELKKDQRISDLKAIKTGQVFQVPIGAFWWDRPSPEAPLGFMWLATKLYPEYTKDLDLKKETKEFFKKFYNYNLGDEEYNSFF